jgi:hypothetical protein
MNPMALFSLVSLMVVSMLSMMMHSAVRPRVKEALITGLSFMGGYTRLLNEQAGFVPGGQDQDIPANGAIAIKPGLVLLSKSTAGAYTLAAPVAGPQDQGGQDGITMQIVASTAEAHVVTTPALAFNGVDDTATYGGAIGDSMEITSNGGIWIVRNLNGVTLTAV